MGEIYDAPGILGFSAYLNFVSSDMELCKTGTENQIIMKFFACSDVNVL